METKNEKDLDYILKLIKTSWPTLKESIYKKIDITNELTENINNALSTHDIENVKGLLDEREFKLTRQKVNESKRTVEYVINEEFGPISEKDHQELNDILSELIKWRKSYDDAVKRHRYAKEHYKLYTTKFEKCDIVDLLSN